MTERRRRGGAVLARADIGAVAAEPAHSGYEPNSPQSGRARKTGRHMKQGRGRKRSTGGSVPGNRMASFYRSVLPPLVLGVVLLIAWDLATRTGAVSTYFLPTPWDVADRFTHEILHGRLLDYTWETVREALVGGGMGLAAALPLGYLIARSDIAAAALQPYLAASQAMPAVALAPLLALWLGYGLLPIAVLCALLVFFPIQVNTVLGLRQVDAEVMGAARVDGVGWWGMLWYIELPLALPSILAGVRNGFTLSITGAVVGEFVMGGEGLGQLMTVQRQEDDTVGLFTTLIMLCLLAAALYGVIRLFERLVKR
ncbi:ABC transporter permease [Streptomyces albus subsp. albus]|nr:ABC transporter permease [Streptomyces albus subsp. albus]